MMPHPVCYPFPLYLKETSGFRSWAEAACFFAIPFFLWRGFP